MCGVWVCVLVCARASICKVRLSQCSVGRRCEAVRALKRKLAAKPNAAHAGRLGMTTAPGESEALDPDRCAGPLSPAPHFRKSPSAPRQDPAVSSRHVCMQTAQRACTLGPLRAYTFENPRQPRGRSQQCRLGTYVRKQRVACPARVRPARLCVLCTSHLGCAAAHHVAFVDLEPVVAVLRSRGALPAVILRAAQVALIRTIRLSCD